MNEYQQQILENYRNPANFGKPKFAYTHTLSLENKSCGDKITLYLKVKDGLIKDISFEGEGCSISIATASLLYSAVKDKTVSEIESITLDDVLDMIGIELTSARIKCANLSLEALKSSLL